MDADYFARYPAQPPQQQLSPAAKAGIAAAAGVTGAAVLAVAFVLLIRRVRLQQQKGLLPIKSDNSAGSPANNTMLISTADPKGFKPSEVQEVGQEAAGAVVVFDTASGSGSHIGYSSGSGSNSTSLELTVPPPYRDSTDSVATSDSGKCLLSGAASSGRSWGIVPTAPKVPAIIRGTMTREQAASIKLGKGMGCSFWCYDVPSATL